MKANITINDIDKVRAQALRWVKKSENCRFEGMPFYLLRIGRLHRNRLRTLGRHQESKKVAVLWNHDFPKGATCPEAFGTAFTENRRCLPATGRPSLRTPHTQFVGMGFIAHQQGT